jgi:uncharacterized protein (DUF58 family)
MAEALIDRQLLEKLERLTIHWQRSFRGLVGGHNASRFSGPGQEFLDHRSFHHGDDLRAVNWRAYMRFGKLFLKLFQTEPRTPIRILLDASASMAAPAGPGETSKFDYARRLAAALVYVGLVRHDSIVLQPFHERLDEAFLASGGRHRFGPTADFISSLACGGRTRYFELARQFLNVYSKPGLLVVIADFLDDEGCARPLQYLADFGHELLLLHLWTPSEREPELAGDLTLTDSETGAPLEIALDREACRRYTEAFDRHADTIEFLALRNGGRYLGFPTSVPLDEAIYSCLEVTPRSA